MVGEQEVAGTASRLKTLIVDRSTDIGSYRVVVEQCLVNVEHDIAVYRLVVLSLILISTVRVAECSEGRCIHLVTYAIF